MHGPSSGSGRQSWHELIFNGLAHPRTHCVHYEWENAMWPGLGAQTGIRVEPEAQPDAEPEGDGEEHDNSSDLGPRRAARGMGTIGSWLI